MPLQDKLSRRGLLLGGTAVAIAGSKAAFAEDLSSPGIALTEIPFNAPVEPEPFTVFVKPNEIMTRGMSDVIVDNRDFTSAFIRSQTGIVNRVRRVAGDDNIGLDSFSIDDSGRVVIQSPVLRNRMDEIYEMMGTEQMADGDTNIWCDEQCK